MGSENHYRSEVEAAVIRSVPFVMALSTRHPADSMTDPNRHTLHTSQSVTTDGPAASRCSSAHAALKLLRGLVLPSCVTE
jgi:hypothetical protein